MSSVPFCITSLLSLTSGRMKSPRCMGAAQGRVQDMQYTAFMAKRESPAELMAAGAGLLRQPRAQAAAQLVAHAGEGGQALHFVAPFRGGVRQAPVDALDAAGGSWGRFRRRGRRR